MKQKGPIFIVSVSLAIGAFMLFVATLPKTVNVQTEMNSENSKEEILSYLSTSENWKDWLFYIPKSELRYIQNGPLRGKGAGFKWFHENEGDGVIEIVDVLEDRVVYQLVTDNGQYRDKGSFVVKDNEGKTAIVWEDTLDVSTNLYARWSARNESFGFRLGLKNFSTLVKIDSLMLNSSSSENPNYLK